MRVAMPGDLDKTWIGQKHVPLLRLCRASVFPYANQCWLASGYALKLAADETDLVTRPDCETHAV